MNTLFDNLNEIKDKLYLSPSNIKNSFNNIITYFSNRNNYFKDMYPIEDYPDLIDQLPKYIYHYTRSGDEQSVKSNGLKSPVFCFLRQVNKREIPNYSRSYFMDDPDVWRTWKLECKIDVSKLNKKNFRIDLGYGYSGGHGKLSTKLSDNASVVYFANIPKSAIQIIPCEFKIFTKQDDNRSIEIVKRVK